MQKLRAAVMTTTVLWAAGLLPAAPALGIEGSRGVREEFRWQGTLTAGQTVEVNGVVGSIAAEPASGDEVEVVALKHGDGDPEEVAIEVVGHENGVTVCAVYPRDEFGRPWQCRPTGGGGHRVASLFDGRAKVRYEQGGGGDVRLPGIGVDFVVRIPAGLHLIARTLDGDIHAVGLAGSIEAHTLKGDVVVSVPEAPGGNVRAESAEGSLVSDYPLDMKSNLTGMRGKGRIGRGARRLHLRTVAGSVMLRRHLAQIEGVE